MSRVRIERAAKRAGYIIVSAHYDWTPTPGEMVPQWEVVFQDAERKFDPDYKYFANSAEAIEFFAGLAGGQS